MDAENKGFMLFRTYKPMVDIMTDEQAGKLLRLLFEYFETWDVPDIDDGMIKAVFALVSSDMRKADENWKKVCARNAENGRKGGRPKKAAEPAETEETQPNPTEPTGFFGNRENPTEPKKAKLKLKLKENINISDPLITSTGESVPAPPEADCEAIPLNDGTEWKPSADLFAEWERLYPGIDVNQKIRDMRGWCLSNPTRRKTRRGVQAFVTSWLSREQNKAPATAQEKRKTRFDNFPSHGTDYDALMWGMVAGGEK